MSTSNLWLSLSLHVHGYFHACLVLVNVHAYSHFIASCCMKLPVAVPTTHCHSSSLYISEPLDPAFQISFIAVARKHSGGRVQVWDHVLLLVVAVPSSSIFALGIHQLSLKMNSVQSLCLLESLYLRM